MLTEETLAAMKTNAPLLHAEYLRMRDENKAANALLLEGNRLLNVKQQEFDELRVAFRTMLKDMKEALADALNQLAVARKSRDEALKELEQTKKHYNKALAYTRELERESGRNP